MLRNIDIIVLSLTCHFQKGQNHFRSSKIGRVIKFCVDRHIFEFLATTNLDGDRELAGDHRLAGGHRLAGDRGLDLLFANFYHILYYLPILI